MPDVFVIDATHVLECTVPLLLLVARLVVVVLLSSYSNFLWKDPKRRPKTIFVVRRDQAQQKIIIKEPSITRN